MNTILVPVDFSEETPEVIEAAAMLARRNRSRLVLLHVAACAGNGAGTDACDKLERLERYLREEGLEVSTAMREGEPAREIVAAGGALAADCIIIGRHDRAAASAVTR